MTKFADLIAALREAPEGTPTLDQWVATAFGFRQSFDGTQWQHPVTKVWTPDIPAFTRNLEAAYSLMWPYATLSMNQGRSPTENKIVFSVTLDTPYVEHPVMAATFPLTVCLASILVYYIVQQTAPSGDPT